MLHMINIVLDIDGTLCYLNRPVLHQICNTEMELQIPDERLAGLNEAAFLGLPEVLAKRADLGEERFAYEFGWMVFHPSCLRTSLVIPGSVQGMKKLQALGKLSYYTARFSRDKQRMTGIREATHKWLAEHGFPAGDVVFCDTIAGKLQRLEELALNTGEPVVLVDDSYHRIIELAQAKPGLSASLTLVALRAQAIEETYGLTVISMKNWHDIEHVIIQLAETHHVVQRRSRSYP
jgi:hypothetical protein